MAGNVDYKNICYVITHGEEKEEENPLQSRCLLYLRPTPLPPLPRSSPSPWPAYPCSLPWSAVFPHLLTKERLASIFHHRVRGLRTVGVLVCRGQQCMHHTYIMYAYAVQCIKSVESPLGCV